MSNEQIPSTLEHLAVPTAGLIPYGRNPRKGNIPLIKESLEFHGQYKPIVVRSGTNEVLAGNHTLKAAKELGWEKIAVTFIDVTDDQAARIVLIDNRSNDVAGYDEKLLQEIIDDLPDLQGTGFTEENLSDYSDDAESRAATGSLVERFGAPPFTVLDARQGAWQDRKRAWKDMGIESEVGRDDDLIYSAGATQFSNWYDVKQRAEKDAGRKIPEAELRETHGHLLVPMAGLGTSVFDPVLCELMYRWYSPQNGHILDPWAGGSVRGIVAARLGRRYTGIELRPEQVEANRAQTGLANGPLPAHLAAPFGTSDTGTQTVAEDYTPDVTPIEMHNGFYVKREDAWTRGGASGAKSRAMFAVVAQNGNTGLITAGAKNSAQIERGALVARALGIPCHIHTGFGKDTPEIATVRAAGATVLGHKPARMSVISARLRTDSEENPSFASFPFGMKSEVYAEQVAAQVTDIPTEVQRIVVPFGSGMTLSGVVRGVQRLDFPLPIIAISVGSSSTDYLDQFAPGWEEHVTIIEDPSKYEDPEPRNMLGDLALDPIYEAKCVKYLEPGDLLWTVGLRNSANVQPEPTNAEPNWIQGESTRTLQDLPKEQMFDMILGCPPYYGLEKYSDDPQDLSNLTYDDFDSAMSTNLRSAVEHLNDDSFAVFIVGAVRDPKGILHDMRSLMVKAGAEAGLTLHNDCILVTALGTAAFRAGRSFDASRILARTHQDVLIFLKGNRKVAADKMSTLEAQATLRLLEDMNPDGDDSE